MSVVRLADIIIPSVFTPYTLQRTLELSALARSGVMQPDAQIDALAQGAGATFNLPFWNDLTGGSKIESDDPAAKITPSSINTGQDVAGKHFRAEAWSTMDLAGELAGSDPARVIADRVAAFWARDMQAILIAALDGVIADNVANDGGDMIVDVATDAVGAPVAAEKISADLILTSKQTMGDAAGELTALVIHSVLHTELQRQGLIQFIPNDRSDIGWGTYMGYTIIVDDGVPAVAGVNRITYTSYLFGAGAVAFGEGTPKVPVAVEREEASGNGSGQETLYNRKHFILHPRGIKWNAANVAGLSATNAELALATNWTRVYQRKAVKFAAIKTNG